MTGDRRGRCLCAAIVLGVLGLPPARGASASGLWEGLIAASSDNVYHGLSQTRGDPALLGDVHYRLESGWFAGVSASTVKLSPGPGGRTELDVYAGRALALSRDWTGKFTLLRYEYPNDRAELSSSYEEVLVGVSYRDWLFGNFSYSPDTSRYTGYGTVYRRPANSIEIAAQLPLRGGWSLNSGVGRYALVSPISSSYWYWSAGITFNRGSFQLALDAIGTDSAARRLFGDATAGERLVVSIIRRFAPAR